MKSTRFFHIRPNLNNGGATVRVTGDDESIGQVDVQVAFCHTFTKTDRQNPKLVPKKRTVRMLDAEGEIIGAKEVDIVVKQFKGDAYCKKTGRSQAEQAKPKVVPLRYLPAELGRIFVDAADRAGVAIVDVPDYSFAMKYWLPKE
jgi:hypothetical protein